MTSGPPAPRSAGLPSLVDALLPNRVDRPLEELATATFLDRGVAVPVSPVDQLLMAFTRRLVTDTDLGGVAVIQLPRARHRTALLLAITSHLLCRQPPPGCLDGPVVLIGLDVDLADQLRGLAVQHHRRMGLALGNPLSAHRLTRAGQLQPLVGSVTGSPDRALIYFNTRVGSPTLACLPPLVILDGTSVTHPSARVRAVRWALDHGSRAIVIVADMGDDGATDALSVTGIVPTVLAITDAVAVELVATLGKAEPPPSTLSSMPVLTSPRTQVSLYTVAGGDADEAVTRAFESLGAKPEGGTPPELTLPMNMLRNALRLAARVPDYRTACTNNVRPGESPALLRLERMDPSLPPHWRAWKITNWGALKVAIRRLWRALEQENPKLLELWRVLDDLQHEGAGTILVRCHSRAAAAAAEASLSTGARTDAQQELWVRIAGRVEFGTFKDRYAAGRFDAQVLTGAPPPWLFSLLVGIEAATTRVLAYHAEEAAFRRYGQAWGERAAGWQRALCRVTGATLLPDITLPVPDLSVQTPTAAPQISVPDMSLADIFQKAAAAVEEPEPDGGATAPPVGGVATKACIPVELSDGRTWWCIDEGDGTTPVVVVTAAGHHHRPVRELRAGDRIVVPAGEGTESVHARLVAASRTNDEVQTLDLILSQFRAAARAVLQGVNRNAAVERVRVAGAQHPDQLQAWATGKTIAPREPGDVEAVFRAAGRDCPDLGLIYAVADALRGLSRTLGRFVAAIAAGRGEEAAIAQLRALVGSAADELLDEFVVIEVVRTGPARPVPGSIAGRVR